MFFVIQFALTLIFVETKRGADALERWLSMNGFPAISIHGDKVQMVGFYSLSSPVYNVLYDLYLFSHGYVALVRCSISVYTLMLIRHGFPSYLYKCELYFDWYLAPVC